MERVELARHHLAQERPEEALRLLAQLLHEDPSDPELHALQAAALFDAERYGEAVHAAKGGLELDPESEPLLDVLGLAHSRLGRLDLAEEALLAALRLDPDDPVLLAHYALVLAEGGQEKATRVLARAEAIDPEDEVVMRVRVAVPYLLGQDDAAGRHGRALLEEEPLDPVAHSILGTLASGRGSSRAARRHFEEVVRDDFTDPEAAEVAWEARALAHPLMWPLWPLYRLGVVKFWLLGIGGFGLLVAIELGPVAAVWLVTYLFIVAYSWVAPPLIRRWVWRGRS